MVYSTAYVEKLTAYVELYFKCFMNTFYDLDRSKKCLHQEHRVLLSRRRYCICYVSNLEIVGTMSFFLPNRVDMGPMIILARLSSQQS